MAKMIFDKDGLLEEPCLSCDKAYVEDIWNEWCCDESDYACNYILDIINKYKEDGSHMQ